MSTNATTTPPLEMVPPKKKKAWSQERAMILLALVFAGGVVALTLIPEDSVMRSIFMPVYMLILGWALFKR